MFGLDKLKLVMDVEDVEVINENVFEKRIVEGEIIGLTFEQKVPFLLKIKIDYNQREAVVEFTGKALLSEYHKLIRLNNIKVVIDNINAIGVCKINNYMSADVLKTDCTIDVYYPYVRGISDFINSNLSNYRKYVGRYLDNGNFIVEKNVTTKQYKKRLTIYNKFIEMEKAKHRNFLKKYYDGENPFVHNNCRFELNLNSKEQIRSSLHITNTKLKNVLLAAQDVNPIYDFLNKIISEDVTSVVEGSKINDYYTALVLKDCDYDIKKVEAKLRMYYSKGTKMRTVLKRYKQMLSIMNNKHSKYTRDEILSLVKTETQITQRVKFECL
jgi:hypothetical protein